MYTIVTALASVIILVRIATIRPLNSPLQNWCVQGEDVGIIGYMGMICAGVGVLLISTASSAPAAVTLARDKLLADLPGPDTSGIESITIVDEMPAITINNGTGDSEHIVLRKHNTKQKDAPHESRAVHGVPVPVAFPSPG
jgi:hypothetical protein